MTLENEMRMSVARFVIGTAVACAAATTLLMAQAPAAPAAGATAAAQAGAPAVSVAVANPTYISIPMEIMVDRPAADVWKRVGKYCDIAEWLRIPTCTITSRS